LASPDDDTTLMIARAVQGEGHALDQRGRLRAASSHFMIAAELWRTLKQYESAETCDHLAASCSDERALLRRRRRREQPGVEA
jgi:hypothetical protein